MEKEQIQQIVNKLTETIDLYDKPIKEKWDSTFPNYPITVSPILCIIGFLFAYIVIVPIIKKFICNIKNCLCLGKKRYEEDMIYLHKYGNVDQYLPSLVRLKHIYLILIINGIILFFNINIYECTKNIYYFILFKMLYLKQSPFCLKLEAYLRFASLKYTVVQKPDFSLAPKGKLPFIERNGEILDVS